MELRLIEKKDYKIYLNYVKRIYRENPLTRDSMTDLLKGILLGKSIICDSVEHYPYMVFENGKPIMACVLAIVDRMDDILQMSFFEATEENYDAFDLLYNKALDIAKEKKISKLSGGLNIHVNYGLGFLDNQFDKVQGFGMAYNQPYYNSFFRGRGFEEIGLVTYLSEMSKFDLPISERLLKRINAKYTVRKADFKKIEREAKIYTEVNNDAFSEHLFYFQRRIEEDLELFKDFKHLLNEENLLFVEKDNEPVGFMLWYPDYHELMSNKETLGVKTVIWNRLFGEKIKKFKIVEMGVIKAEQKGGAIVALFDHLNGIVKGRYEFCESGWILEENRDSRNFGLKWAEAEAKKYKAYIKDLDNEDI